MLFTRRTHAIGRLHINLIFTEATPNYLYYNASTVTSEGMFVRIQQNTASFEAMASHIGYRNCSYQVVRVDIFLCCRH